MNTRIIKWILPLLVTFGALLTTSACVVHTMPSDNVYVANGAPEYISYGGRDLYYRTDGYYYYDRGGWLIAPSVPAYVQSYHRPVYYSNSYRPSYSRPSYSRPSYSRPSYSRPVYQGSHTRPIHTTSRPVTNHRPTTSRPQAVQPSRPTSSGPTHVTRPSSGSSARPPAGNSRPPASSGPRRVTRQ